ncbi:hypothetical protein LCGC14_3031100, partial [marine sediment metagenome]
MRPAVCFCMVAVAWAAAGGCASRTTSNTPRTAVEQLLLSRAVDLSLEKFDVPEVK